MAGIFICYRREDTAGWAGRLQADLQAGLKRAHIFRDIDAIPPGVKFDKYIADALGTCDVLIALIGPRWLQAVDAQGSPRLADPNDLIRLEISTCLRREIRVIPALVGDAVLPGADELPADIRDLTRRQAYELSDSRWSDDCQKLIAALKPLTGARAVPRRAIVATAAALVVLALAIAVPWQRQRDGGGSPVADEAQSAATNSSAAGSPAGTRLLEAGAANRAGPVPPSANGVPTTGPNVAYIPGGGGAGAGVFDFVWPGSDCWNIFRGDEKVTYGCGAAKQALSAGTYTIKTNTEVFFPFEVSIRPGTTARVTLGGTFDFRWPGSDCWDIYRGEQKVTYGCGRGTQALQAGQYTIKAGPPVFLPFDVAVRTGVTTTVAKGGVFEFKWPGSDCWEIYRSDVKVTYGCGTGRQALEAGSYTVKASSGAVFQPFQITVRDGSTATFP